MAKKGGKVCFSMAPIAAATVVRRRGKAEKKRKVLVSCVGGGEPACQYPASASPLGIYRSQGYLQRGKGGGVSAEWKGGISGLVVARGNHAKKSRFGWGMLYPIWRDRRRIGRQQKEKPFVPKRSEDKGLIRFAMWQTLLMIIS